MKLIKLNASLNKNEIIDLITENSNVEQKEVLKEAFLTRELQFSTGMTDGIAIPHALIDTPNKELIFVQIPDKVTNWETLDDSSVDLVIAIIAPKNGEEHLKTLQKLSQKLMKKEIVEQIKNCVTIEEIKLLLDLNE